MSKPKRHRWGEKNHVSNYKTEQECLDGCVTIKVTRRESEGGFTKRWIEYWRDQEMIAVDAAPPCEPMIRGMAIFSPDRRYRYRLEREIQAEGVIAAVIMVNGSDADEAANDPTVRKLIGFGRRLGWRHIIIGNAFAFVSTDVKGLRCAADPIGADNDRHLAEIMRDADLVVVGWGTLSKLPEALRKRWIDVVKVADAAGRELHCLGTNDDGHPRHPLMTGYDVPLTRWEAPWFAGRRRPAATNVERVA